MQSKLELFRQVLKSKLNEAVATTALRDSIRIQQIVDPIDMTPTSAAPRRLPIGTRSHSDLRSMASFFDFAIHDSNRADESPHSRLLCLGHLSRIIHSGAPATWSQP